jgi:hypothetical protein
MTRSSPSQLADIIRGDPRWTGAAIQLCSCNTGKGNNSFAQQLANELGVPVFGPNRQLWFYPNSPPDVFGRSGRNGPINRGDPGSIIEFKPQGN